MQLFYGVMKQQDKKERWKRDADEICGTSQGSEDYRQAAEKDPSQLWDPSPSQKDIWAKREGGDKEGYVL